MLQSLGIYISLLGANWWPFCFQYCVTYSWIFLRWNVTWDNGRAVRYHANKNPGPQLWLGCVLQYHSALPVAITKPSRVSSKVDDDKTLQHSLWSISLRKTTSCFRGRVYFWCSVSHNIHVLVLPQNTSDHYRRLIQYRNTFAIPRLHNSFPLENCHLLSVFILFSVTFVSLLLNVEWRH